MAGRRFYTPARVFARILILRESKMWNCSNCTTFNTDDEKTCGHCSTARASSPSSASPASWEGADEKISPANLSKTPSGDSRKPQIKTGMKIGGSTVGAHISSGPLTLVYSETDESGHPTGNIIKFLKPELAANPDVAYGFRRALLLWESVRCRGLLRPLAFWDGRSAEIPWVRVPDLGENSLQDILDSGKISRITNIVDSAIKIIETIEKIHNSGGVHGSIIPENIFFTKQAGEEYEVIISDPFLHPVINSTSNHSETAINRTTGVLEDIRAIGSILYLLLTGVEPGTSGGVVPPSEINSNLPASMDPVILLALDRNGYSNAAEFRRELENFRQTQSSSFKPATAKPVPNNIAAENPSDSWAVKPMQQRETAAEPHRRSAGLPLFFIFIALIVSVGIFSSVMNQQDEMKRINEEHARLMEMRRENLMKERKKADTARKKALKSARAAAAAAIAAARAASKADSNGSAENRALPSEAAPEIATTTRSRPLPEPPAGKAPLELNGWAGLTKNGDKLINSLGMNFVALPSGSFKMGSPGSERGRNPNEFLHTVTLSNAFLIMDGEVTCGQWKKVMGSLPENILKARNGSEPSENTPVSWIKWEEAIAFSVKLNSLCPGDGIYGLPTEAQWEYACRAGSNRSLGSDSNIRRTSGFCPVLDQMGRFVANSNGQPWPKGSRAPNRWALFDMHGNLWEWCLDSVSWMGGIQGSTYRKPREIDPCSREGDYRIIRGGSFVNEPNVCRSAFRSALKTTSANATTGFRLVLIPPAQNQSK